MVVVWGSDLIEIYNDGYREMLGSEKHPEALGAPTKVVWSEIWDVICPLFEDAMSSGRPTWSEHLRLEINRHGFLEECWFTFSYIPIIDDDGSIGGVLNTVAETTQQVITERRLGCVGRLAAELVSGMQATDVCSRAATALSACAQGCCLRRDASASGGRSRPGGIRPPSRFERRW